MLLVFGIYYLVCVFVDPYFLTDEFKETHQHREGYDRWIRNRSIVTFLISISVFMIYFGVDGADWLVFVGGAVYLVGIFTRINMDLKFKKIP